MDEDNFQRNISAVDDLVSSHTNKVYTGNSDEEGVVGDYQDELSLDLSDEELLDLKKQYESDYAGYAPKVVARQKENKKYLLGLQFGNSARKVPVSKNLLFQSTATFVPQALAKNPEPVVFSDNTPQGKEASKGLKTMLQFHAENFLLRKKLGIMVWHWGVYFTAILKYGWDETTKDITVEVRNPQNFLFEPTGYVDEFGDFVGWIGEKIETTAQKLIDTFPEHKAYILDKVKGKVGTKVVRTEWWTDEYCFTTFFDKVLDKHKNEFFNYDTKGQSTEESEAGEETLKGHNHFAKPKMPYTFLSIFSLQEQPHDITNLIEQNISNQDQINVRDEQIDRNLKSANNAVAISGVSFNQETASQAVQSFYEEGFILVPDGNVDGAIKRIPANDLPSGIFTSQENAQNALMSVYGSQGLTADAPDTDQTAHGMVINTNRDSSRIGGGVGEALEQVAANFFNKLTQMYYVFYDEPHFAAVMGNGAAVSYIQLQMQDEERRFIVNVSPNSMKPKDEVSQQNLATELFQAGASDPLTYLEDIDNPDPQETALRLMIFRTNPQQYIQSYLSPTPEQQQQGVGQPQQGQIPNQGGEQNPSLSAPAESSSLANTGMSDVSQQPNITT
jgi:hypothetical protein